MLPDTTTLRDLLNTLPQAGRVQWIGLRPAARAAVVAVPSAELLARQGLAGDHRAERGGGGKRQVTLIQHEHLAAVAGMLGLGEIDPALLRRNLVVSGINLMALHDRRFHVGAAILEGTGYCHPCSRMEENLGPGGYNAMRGHGGITARVLTGAHIALGDELRLLAD